MSLPDYEMPPLKISHLATGHLKKLLSMEQKKYTHQQEREKRQLNTIEAFDSLKKSMAKLSKIICKGDEPQNVESVCLAADLLRKGVEKL